MCTCPFCAHMQFQSVEPMPDGRERDWMWAIGRHNLVTHVRHSRISYGQHAGPLSLKSIIHGEEAYETDGMRRVVDRDHYLILNQGQRYSSAMERDEPSESFCVWFKPSFAEEALAGLSSSEDDLLNEPHRKPREQFVFVDRLYCRDDEVSSVLQRMHRAFNAGLSTAQWLDEQFHLLLEAMLLTQRHVRREIERVPAARRSTRMETYRRLHRAKDYLESNLTVPVPLSEAASVAWLSPHHFLRQFQSLFGESPRQYQTRRRMEKARELLLRTDQPVTDICFGLGFESLGSFSWLFRRLHGASPSQFRARRAFILPENGKHEEVMGHRDR